MIEIDDVVEAQRQWQSIVVSHPDRLPEAVMGSVELCSEALDVLAQGLAEICYPVPVTRTPCDQGLGERVARLERLMGKGVPKVLVHFWRTVGGVSCVDLSHYTHVRFWRELGVRGEFCDGLHIDACTDEWIAGVVEDYRAWSRNPPAFAADGEPYPFWLPLCPDGYHKDDISGGPPDGVQCDDAWAPTCSFEWYGPERPRSALSERMDFISYLRTTVLECAGCPGLLGDPAFEKAREKLLNDLPLF
jgi:hypothetical protein